MPFKGKHITNLDLEALRRAAMFNPNNLHLGPRAATSMAMGLIADPRDFFGCSGVCLGIQDEQRGQALCQGNPLPLSRCRR
jgi:hypothetical protein